VNPSALPDSTTLPPGQDYAWLRAEGIRQLQQLSGRIWTDYNDHDPGVTLLEALCFVLTDVSYRAALPIPALLGPGRDAPGKSTFIPAHEVFANHPVTPGDYRKLILDEFHALVKNAWVTPLTDAAGQPVAPGHYQVHLEPLLPQGDDGTAPLPVAFDTLPAEVLQFLNQHRNLGEVFGRVVLLKLRPLAVGGQLELAAGYVPAQVLAELLWQLNYVLSPYLLVETVSEKLAAGTAPEDIFAGPRAVNRLLVTSQLTPRLTRIDLSQLLKGAYAVPGLSQLRSLRLYPNPAADDTADFLQFADDEAPTLDLTTSLSRLRVSQQGVPQLVDAAQVLVAYHKLMRTGARGLHNLPRPDQLRLPAPPASNFHPDLAHYDSVQHLLPALYGVGADGPPTHVTAATRAYVMQLKGYLLMFDQLLANFCAQLANVGHFFSPTPQPLTYYSAPLYGVPHVAPLLPETNISPDAAWENAPATAVRWQVYQDNESNPYQRELRRLDSSLNDSQAHRQTFLAHLLARFGYSVQFYQQPGDAAPARAYEQLLSNLSMATYHRAAARVQPGPGSGAESGLEFFLFLLAGLESLPRKWAQGQALPELEGQVRLHGYRGEYLRHEQHRHGHHHHHDEQQPGNPAPPSASTAEEQSALFRAPGAARGAATGQPSLLVWGGVGDFEEFYAAMRHQLRRPTLMPRSATVAVFTVHGPGTGERWELELVNEPARHPDPAVAANPAQRLLSYATRLDQQLERFSVLDHLVLKPLAPPNMPTPTDADDRAAANFYHCQLTVLLPGYARRFEPGPNAETGQSAGNRAFVEGLVRQYAPAHLLVNLVWLDYPAMREWEALYGELAALSPLLDAPGRPAPTLLATAQQNVRQFLEARLPHPA